MALFLCFLSFILCYMAGRRSLVNGLVALLCVGYAYGITRANLPNAFSHFIFDAGVIGLYLAQLFRPLDPYQQFKVQPLKPWVEFMIAWPVLLLFIPIQDTLIQFVGLRGNIFLLPFLLIGARLKPEERYQLALSVAVLNIVALAFAGAEFFLGVERFFPLNEVTKLIYLSRDIAGHTAFRIPASFANAHSYAGTMVVTIPLLGGALIQNHRQNWHRKLIMVAIAASLLGVFMSGARIHFVVACLLVIIATFSIGSKYGYALGWIIMLCVIGWVVSSEERLQRFIELKNADAVAERVSWSVNMSFWEAATQYPFGNGLGGGGTSIPYFLQDRIQNPVLIENEYARIMLEQGIIGLLIWIAFIAWLLTRQTNNRNDSWYFGRRLAWVACAAYFSIALLGTGLLTALPQSCLFLLLAGWVSSPQLPEEAKNSFAYQNQMALPERNPG